ncbi:hypothetical protein GCM10028803_14470 [Larkinella knui]|uniref:Uncharacterized protein n=1 Tax=Larkinella knui TaxID=2025310 RepID=A0A3P1CBB8_9BACT|nr:hypothetical protein [Larkinella knui]RRB10613.1 hypothetical protein EHT87_25960 [Larkinella knui]
MKTIQEYLLDFGLQEIQEDGLQKVNGGYGYWEGHNQGSAALSSLVASASEAVAGAWDEFCTGFSGGYSNARQGR